MGYGKIGARLYRVSYGVSEVEKLTATVLELICLNYSCLICHALGNDVLDILSYAFFKFKEKFSVVDDAVFYHLSASVRKDLGIQGVECGVVTYNSQGLMECAHEIFTRAKIHSRFAADRGLPVSSEKIDDKHYVIRMEVSDPKAASAKEEAPGCIPDLRGNTVIAIASDCMGSGDDKLGATLMKGFIYAVSQQEELPSAMLFYNSGAKLTAEGAVTVEDLKSLEAQGVEILTCGTCANFFGLEGKQAVGSITNMYVIVEKLTSADKVIRP